ncbi:PAS domain S-box protein [Desulfococcaceae bacterium HSG8]|nr:PAS domain S-box protein [Desulfococcaceae bacterium HSG8]
MSLSTKIISMLLLVLAVLLSLSGWSSVKKEKQMLNELLEGRGKSISHSIAVFCIETLLSEDYPVLNTFLETVGRERDDILSIEVIHNGKIVSDYFAKKKDMPESAMFSSDILFSIEDAGSMPVEKLGEVRLRLSSRENNLIIAARIRELIINTTIIFILLFLTLLLVMRKIILQKVTLLSRHAKLIGEGNFDLRINLKTNDELGKLASAFNNMLDTVINSQKRLRESEEKFRSISASAMDAIIMLDNDGNISYWNEAAEEIFGHLSQEVLGMAGHHVFAPPHYREAYQKGLAEFKKTGKGAIVGKTLEVEGIRKDGTLFPAELSVSSVNMGGKWNAIGILRDISERREAENELAKYRDDLEDMVRERTRDLKAAQEELIGKATDAGIEAGRSQLSAMVLHNIGNALTPLKVCMEEMKTDEPNQAVAYLEKCYADLADHAEQLEYANNDPRGKEVFSYMGSLIGSLTASDDKRSARLDKMDTSVSYISEIITLHQSHAAVGQEIRERTDLNGLIEGSVRMQTGSLEKRGIVLEKNLASDLPKLIIDKNRLMQVVVNFIKNAYEAIDEMEGEDIKKVITIRTFADNRQLGFEITDTGIGIEPDQIHKIFEFGRSQKGSSGVGLHYCRMFVEANRGILDISSPGKGKGATVSVAFKIGV